MQKLTHIIECVICRDQKDKETHKWFTPTALQRRTDHFKNQKISHGYCPICYIEMIKHEGVSAEEIIEIAKQTLITDQE